MTALDFDRVFLFALSDLDERATIRDRSYGLLDIRGQPKPVYHALSRFLRLTGPHLTPAKAPVLANAPADLISVSWRREDGKRLLVFWAEREGELRLPEIHLGVLNDPLAGTERPYHMDQGLTVLARKHLRILVW
ncbi:MAG: hypothetical protein IPM37_21235 [Hahellaceae bacterium]|nr:hypothetical protein [Hahellaceae bacterium]